MKKILLILFLLVLFGCQNNDRRKLAVMDSLSVDTTLNTSAVKKKNFNPELEKVAYGH